jgi:hypothetical protein
MEWSRSLLAELRTEPFPQVFGNLGINPTCKARCRRDGENYSLEHVHYIFWNMRLECRYAGARLLGLRSTGRNSARVMHHSALSLPMPFQLYTRLIDNSGRAHLDRPADELPQMPSIPSSSVRCFDTACRWLPDILHCLSHWSGDAVTFDGATFLDVSARTLCFDHARDVDWHLV